MEVLVSAIIFSLILVGLSNIFVAGKRYIAHSRARMSGGELGKAFMDPLTNQVRQDLWGANCISQDNTSDCSILNQTIGNITYSVTYNISSGPLDPEGNATDVRRVNATISWTEPSL